VAKMIVNIRKQKEKFETTQFPDRSVSIRGVLSMQVEHAGKSDAPTYIANTI
jgi:hypothetical protein